MSNTGGNSNSNSNSTATQEAMGARTRWLASCAGAWIAETLTLPTDVVKTRLQTRQKVPYSGVLNCFSRMVREEGTTALWKGLSPALLRQVSYSSLSLVLYEPILKQLGGEPGFKERLLAGGSAGAISISVFNWTEVIKTRLQTSHGNSTIGGVVKEVWKARGISGFWAGAQANVCRTFLVNAAELGTYDQGKNFLREKLGEERPFLVQVCASSVAGFFSACVSTPADVVKTRLMAQSGSTSERYEIKSVSGGPSGTNVISGGKYKGMCDAFIRIVREEGYATLYKGFAPILVRKVLWTSVFFLSYERVRDSFQ